MNLSVSHPLASSPGRRALGKEISFSMKLICICWKTSRNAKASPTRKDSPGRGRWHASAERGQWHRAKRSRDGEVVQSSTCVLRSI